MPFFSIVTATYNASRYLARCRDSILRQTYKDLEWVVQDGGSIDGTVEMLRDIDDSRLSFVSEPDSGVYDAWNKALTRCSGEWLLFLGADDFLFGMDILQQCMNYLQQTPASTVFAYGALFFVNDDKTVGGRLNKSLSAMYQSLPGNQGFPFPATFVKGDAARHTKFNITYRVAGDYAFAASLISRYNVVRLPLYIAGMQTGGLSTSPSLSAITYAERKRVIQEIVIPRARELLQGGCDHLEETDALCLNRGALRRRRRWDSLRRLQYKFGRFIRQKSSD